MTFFFNRNPPGFTELNTSSLQKYYGMIRRWGSWELFQRLLKALHSIAEKHHVSIAIIAMRWVIEQSSVASLIIGARLSLSDHIYENLNLYSYQLDQRDHETIREIYQAGNNLFNLIGDCGNEYR